MNHNGPLPKQILYNITERCNLRCQTCDSWKNIINNEMSIDQIKTMLDDLRNWLGPFHLEIAGGEPTVRKDLPEILLFASDLDIQISLTTNGYLFTDELTETIINTCKCINFSLLSLKDDVHDFIRGVPGSCRNVKNAILTTKRKSNESQNHVYINILSILLLQNHSDMIPLLNWNIKHDIGQLSLQALSFPFFSSQFDQNWKQKSIFWPHSTDEKMSIKSMIEQLVHFKNSDEDLSWRLANTTSQLIEMSNYFLSE